MSGARRPIASLQDYLQKLNLSKPDKKNLEEFKKALEKIDFYTILQVDKKASESEIQKAFKKLAVVIHPDKADPKDKEIAEEIFKHLSTAHMTLNDTLTKTEYDNKSKNSPASATPTPQSATASASASQSTVPPKPAANFTPPKSKPSVAPSPPKIPPPIFRKKSIDESTDEELDQQIARDRKRERLVLNFHNGWLKYAETADFKLLENELKNKFLKMPSEHLFLINQHDTQRNQDALSKTNNLYLSISKNNKLTDDQKMQLSELLIKAKYGCAEYLTPIVKISNGIFIDNLLDKLVLLWVKPEKLGLVNNDFVSNHCPRGDDNLYLSVLQNPKLDENQKVFYLNKLYKEKEYQLSAYLLIALNHYKFNLEKLSDVVTSAYEYVCFKVKQQNILPPELEKQIWKIILDPDKKHLESLYRIAEYRSPDRYSHVSLQETPFAKKALNMCLDYLGSLKDIDQVIKLYNMVYPAFFGQDRESLKIAADTKILDLCLNLKDEKNVTELTKPAGEFIVQDSECSKSLFTFFNANKTTLENILSKDPKKVAIAKKNLEEKKQSMGFKK